MSLAPTRWHVIAESEFPWEREALAWLREHLPNRDPWHVWCNFEFIDDAGKVNEVDALVLSPAGLFLVEIKSRPGELDGDTHTWTWRTDGRYYTVDNPLLLADRKAKRLATILRRQTAVAKAKIAVPYLEPLIFLSATQIQCKLRGRARSGVLLRGRPGHLEDDGLVGVLQRGLRTPSQAPTDSQQVKAISKALAEAGIRPSNKHRRVGEYKLGKLIAEGDGYQDWLGQHVSIESVQRRIRIHTLASAASPEARAALVRSAGREFEVLEGIEHSGILRCREYKDTELGPALVFDHDPGALRLDHLMREHGATLDVTRRLQLVRDIAEILKFAHGKRLYHRGLGPQSILIRGWGTGQLAVQVMNWQTASRNADASTTAHRTTGTRHVEDYVEDPGRVYLAPETAYAEPGQGAALDVYALGSLTYLIFGGQAPADSSLALQAKLRQGQGLRLADIFDGCPPKLAELVQFSTNPDLGARYDSVDDFLKELDVVEDELTAPDPETTADPSRATVGERLEGGFTVVSRLGRGSSSDALLVKPDGKDEQWVLKVATDAGHNESLLAEADALRKVRHPNIVEWHETRTIAGRTALLLRSAGDETLARKLKRDGRVSLDLLQRFGDELLDAVRELENQAVVHRDIKPDNIGISQSRNGRLKLVLFDFSLSRTPAENISAGTPPYLDPFLSLRSHRRWDLSAERFAAAVTLYEMAVGKPPRWGDGQSAPALLDVEADIEVDAFDPNLRQPLRDFFSKALRRDFRERFDNVEDMLRAWRAVFQQATPATAPVPADDFAALARGFDARTSIAELGYSIEAQDQLERMGIHSVRDLLGVDRIKFRYLSGVGDRIRREIRLKAKELARLRPDLIPGDSSLYSEDGESVADAKTPVTVNELADILMPRRPAGDERAEDDALEHYLGLDDAVAAGNWPTPGEAAGAAQISREAFSAALLKARERWLKQPPLTELRTQVHTLLDSQGQVMTTRELAEAVLALRGCALQKDEDRLRLAHALVRAAVEAEANLESPRFQAFDHQPFHLVARDPLFAQYARALGVAADACALAEPLLPPARALEALENVARPRRAESVADGELAPSRLLRLATSASQRSALSSRQEIYPRGMPALLALKQSLNSLIGIREIKLAELRSRVLGRYPEAAELPRQRALVDRLLEEAGAPLVWDSERDNGGGAYVTRALESGLTVSTATRIERRPTVSDADASSGAEAARQAEQRLTNNLRQGGLLVLGVDTACAASAEAELMHRFGAQSGNETALARMSLDALLLGTLKQQADALDIRWDVVLKADAMPAGSRDAANLMQLVQRCLPALRRALLESSAPLLLVHPGLFARFELFGLISELEAEAGRPGRTPSLWLLLPSPQPERAAIDGKILPLVHASSFATLPQAWVENRHRAGAMA